LRRTLVADVGPQCPQRADGIDTAVVEEVAVLGREHGVDHDLRNLIERDVLTVLLAVQARDRVVGRAVGLDVCATDERRLRLDALGRKFDVGDDVAEPGDAGHQQQSQQEERATPAPEDALALAVGLQVGRVRRFLALHSTRRRPSVGTSGLGRHEGGMPCRRGGA